MQGFKAPAIGILNEAKTLNNKKYEFISIGRSRMIQRSFREECFIMKQDLSYSCLLVTFQILRIRNLTCPSQQSCNSLTTICLGLTSINRWWVPSARLNSATFNLCRLIFASILFCRFCSFCLFPILPSNCKIQQTFSSAKFSASKIF